jgi:hypothetical protein
MSRSVPAALLTALAQPTVRPYYAVEMAFDSATLRYWTGYGERTIEGNTDLGAGEALAFSGIEEVADMASKTATITMSGIPSAMVSLALQEPYQNRPCRILFGCTDVSDVVEAFAGTMDQMPIDDGADTATIAITVVSKWAKLNRANVRRYTSESQKSRYPTDTAFDWVADLQDKDIAWGRTTLS